MTDWSALSASARLYLRPLGPVSSAKAGGHALVLAGGALAFTTLEVIVEEGGERAGSSLVPVAGLDEFLTALPTAHRTRADQTLERIRAPRAPLSIAGGASGIAFTKPVIMGVLNVTPDSFSDGGQFLDAGDALAQAERLMQEGAHILDIGGESTRPGAKPVWEGEEKGRIIPVIEALAGRSVPLSVDTRRASVMAAALEAGAHIINDVSALTYDDDSLGVAAQSDVPVILMHAQGDPRSMQSDPVYGDVLLEVYDYLEDRIDACVAAGIARSRLVIDPGIGFGKTLRHNLALLNGLSLFHGLGCPILIGVSRKTFIGALSREEPAPERLPGSLAAALQGLAQGVQILRVHDVAATRQAIAVAQGLSDASFME